MKVVEGKLIILNFPVSCDTSFFIRVTSSNIEITVDFATHFQIGADSLRIFNNVCYLDLKVIQR